MSNSYMQIYKPKLTSQTLNCDQKISNQVIVRSLSQLNGNIYFQLQAKSEVILSGHYNTITKEIITSDDNLSFGLKFQLISEKIDKLPENKAAQARPKSCEQELIFVENGQATSTSQTTPNNEAKMYPSFKFVPRIIYKWYYDQKTDTCKKILKQTSTQDISNSFDSKRQCENACKMSPCKCVTLKAHLNTKIQKSLRICHFFRRKLI